MQSIWQKDFVNWNLPMINKDTQTKILIIGGGLAGLTCAYEMMKKNFDFILVDAKNLGHGVSANTTSQVSLAHDSLYSDIKNKHSERVAEEYLTEQIKGLNRIKEIIIKEKIACDDRQESTILGASKTNNIKVLQSMLPLIKKQYSDCEMQYGNNDIFNFSTAIEFKQQIIINPVKYLNGLIKVLKKQKVNLYEYSQVTAINKEGASYEVSINDQYKIKCEKIIMACHYPFLLQNLYFTKMYQSTSYAIAFKTKVKLKANYVSLDKPYFYLRTYDHNTLILGGSDHFTGDKSEIHECYNALLKQINTLDKEATIVNKWFSEDCMPLNYLPFVRPFSNYYANIILVTGFQKWGFTNSHAAALKVCDLLRQDSYQPKSLVIGKNIFNYLRMIAHSINGLIISKIFMQCDDIKNVRINSGKAIRYQGKNLLIYRATKNEYYIFKNKCTHLSCSLIWNDIDKVWISKCHGTIYDKYGHVIYGPGIKDLERLN